MGEKRKERRRKMGQKGRARGGVALEMELAERPEKAVGEARVILESATTRVW